MANKRTPLPPQGPRYPGHRTAGFGRGMAAGPYTRSLPTGSSVRSPSLGGSSSLPPIAPSSSISVDTSGVPLSIGPAIMSPSTGPSGGVNRYPIVQDAVQILNPTMPPSVSKPHPEATPPTPSKKMVVARADPEVMPPPSPKSGNENRKRSRDEDDEEVIREMASSGKRKASEVASTALVSPSAGIAATVSTVVGTRPEAISPKHYATHRKISNKHTIALEAWDAQISGNFPLLEEPAAKTWNHKRISELTPRKQLERCQWVHLIQTATTSPRYNYFLCIPVERRPDYLPKSPRDVSCELLKTIHICLLRNIQDPVTKTNLLRTAKSMAEKEVETLVSTAEAITGGEATAPSSTITAVVVSVPGSNGNITPTVVHAGASGSVPAKNKKPAKSGNQKQQICATSSTTGNAQNRQFATLTEKTSSMSLNASSPRTESKTSPSKDVTAVPSPKSNKQTRRVVKQSPVPRPPQKRTLSAKQHSAADGGRTGLTAAELRSYDAEESRLRKEIRDAEMAEVDADRALWKAEHGQQQAKKKKMGLLAANGKEKLERLLAKKAEAQGSRRA